MKSRRLSLRKVAAIAVAAAALVAATVTLVGAQQGGGEAEQKDLAATPEPTPAVPSRLMSLEEARARYLASGRVTDVDEALTSGRPDAVLALWRRSLASCFVGSEKTGTLCSGQSGEPGTRHEVEVVRFQVADTVINLARATQLLNEVLTGNPASLVLVARNEQTGHLFIGYEVDVRDNVLGGDPVVQYLSLKLDLAGELPILFIVAGDATPLRQLRHEGFTTATAFGDLIAVKQDMLDEELRSDP